MLEVAVVGATDQHGLVNPWAFVVPQNGYEASDSLADELKAFVKARLVPHKYPRWITFVTELAKTATGKIRRFMLRDV